MTTQEAKEALKSGLKVRRSHWGEGSYLERAKDGSVQFPDGSPVSVSFFDANEWWPYPSPNVSPKRIIEMLKV